MERIKSGIDGFDNLVSGGFPKGKAFLVAGEPGTGKTIFALQYLLAGLKKGEKVVYVSIDETPSNILDDAMSLGWNLNSYLESGYLKILDVSHYFSTDIINNEDGVDIQKTVQDILNQVKKIDAQRLAIDPVVPLVFKQNKVVEVEAYIRHLIFCVEEERVCTSLLTSHVPVGTKQLSQHGIEEFIVSGIVELKMVKIKNQYLRTLVVRKMRGTSVDLNEFSFDIVKGRGIVLRQHPI